MYNRSELEFDVVLEKDLVVKMRDDIVLAADV